MKKLNWLIALAAFVALSISACYIDVDDDDDGGIFDCVEGQGGIVSVVLPLAHFSGVELYSSGNVYITQGSNREVIVEGQGNIIDRLDRDVRNGVWEIEFDGCVQNYQPLKIFITMPDIRYLEISGSGEIFGQNIFEVNDMDLRIPGSGKIDLGLLADDVDVRIPGSGQIILEGEADELDLRIIGSGSLAAFGLPVREADIDISGSGDAQVTVAEFLDVRISGSGNVFFKGNPVIDVMITGSGEVIDAN